MPCSGARHVNFNRQWGKSFADDFAQLGIVSGRVALLLRSAEIQPVFGRFSMNGIRHSPPPWLANATGRLC